MRTADSSHILDVVDYLKKVLTFSGTWPVRKPSWSHRMRKTISWIFDISIQIFLFAEAYKNFTHREYKELTEMLSIMLSFNSWLIKRTIFELNYGALLSLLEKLDDPVLHDFPKHCDGYIKRANRLTMICAVSFQFFAANMIPFSLFKPIFNAGLAMHFSVVELGHWYYPVHIYECLAMANTCYNNSTMDCLSMALVSVGSTQLEILKDKITYSRQWAGLTTEEIDSGIVNTSPDMDPILDGIILEHLNNCVKHHLKILDLLDNIEKILTYLILSQFFTSVLAFCNTWFQLALEDQLVKILFLVTYATALLIQLGLYCLFGDRVIEKSQELCEACYFADWYKSNKAVNKTLMLIMERAKRPSVITAGKLSVCSLVTYTGLMRMSYSYFALMNRLYGST